MIMKNMKRKTKNLIAASILALGLELIASVFDYGLLSAIIGVIVFYNTYYYLNLRDILNKLGQKIHNVETNHFFKNKEFED